MNSRLLQGNDDMNSLVNQIFRFTTKYRNLIVKLFELSYIILTILLYFGYRAIVMGQGSYDLFYSIGKKMAELGIITFILTCVPGIARRVGISHKLVSVLMIYRRYLGILTFMFIVLHSSFVWFLPSLVSGGILIPGNGFELWGFIALVLLFLLFLTSNDLSTKVLGIWWGRIHALTYVIMWFILLHVMLQGKLPWAFLIGAACIAEVVSFFVARSRRRVV